MGNPARRPCLNEGVHYVSYGTPGGEYQSECRAADITKVVDAGTVHLMVKNPSGLFFNHDVPHIAADLRVGGSWHYESGCYPH